MQHAFNFWPVCTVIKCANASITFTPMYIKILQLSALRAYFGTLQKSRNSQEIVKGGVSYNIINVLNNLW